MHLSSDGTKQKGKPRRDCGCQSCRAAFGAPINGLRGNETAIDFLRRMAHASGNCGEWTWDGLSVGEVLNVLAAWSACEWDFYPDQWTDSQLKEAAKNGTIPQWDNDGRPLPSDERQKANWRTWRGR